MIPFPPDPNQAPTPNSFIVLRNASQPASSYRAIHQPPPPNRKIPYLRVQFHRKIKYNCKKKFNKAISSRRNLSSETLPREATT
jgi:hypothetical protein